jgi:hypothetical protein
MKFGFLPYVVPVSMLALPCAARFPWHIFIVNSIKIIPDIRIVHFVWTGFLTPKMAQLPISNKCLIFKTRPDRRFRAPARMGKQTRQTTKPETSASGQLGCARDLVKRSVSKRHKKWYDISAKGGI